MKTQFTLAVLLFPLFLWCQTGAVKGQLTDAVTNAPIAFGDVLVMGTDRGHVY